MPQAEHRERSEVQLQLQKDDRTWPENVDRNYKPMNKNRTEDSADSAAIELAIEPADVRHALY